MTPLADLVCVRCDTKGCTIVEMHKGPDGTAVETGYCCVEHWLGVERLPDAAIRTAEKS